MATIQRSASVMSAIAALLAGVLLVAMVGHTVLEMVLRAFFYTSTFVLDEFVGYEVAALTMLGLGHALNTGSLIRVNLLTRLLPPRGQRFRLSRRALHFFPQKCRSGRLLLLIPCMHQLAACQSFPRPRVREFHRQRSPFLKKPKP